MRYGHSGMQPVHWGGAGPDHPLGGQRCRTAEGLQATLNAEVTLPVSFLTDVQQTHIYTLLLVNGPLHPQTRYSTASFPKSYEINQAGRNNFKMLLLQLQGPFDYSTVLSYLAGKKLE